VTAIAPALHAPRVVPPARAAAAAIERSATAPSPYLVALAVSLATFMEVLDTNVANVALPHIAGNLAASVDESTWVLTSYLVANAIVLPLSGWLSSLLGRKRFYMTCVGLFTATSLLCGLAPSLGALIFFRVLQGLAGGGLQPSSQAILVDAFPPERRAAGMAIYAVAVVVAPVVGPTLGGWITDNETWRWIFFINVPVGIASIPLVQRLVHDPPHLVRTTLRRVSDFDFAGLGFIAVGLGSLEIVFDEGQRRDWFDSTFIRAFAVLAAIGLVLAVARMLTTENPLVEVRLLKDRHFAASTFMLFVLGFTMYGSTMLLPLLLQQLLGYSAFDAGLALSPGGVVLMVMNMSMGILLTRFEARRLVAVGLVLTALSLWHMASFSLGIDYRTAAIARMMQTFGLAFLFVPINTVAFNFVAPALAGKASGIANLARNIGGSVGIATMSTIIARGAQAHQAMLVAHATPFDAPLKDALSGATGALRAAGLGPVDAGHVAAGEIYARIVREATVLGFADAFRFLAILVLLTIPAAFLLRYVAPGKRGTGGGAH
jgi:DHA2 family multidrug resistance protein